MYSFYLETFAHRNSIPARISNLEQKNTLPFREKQGVFELSRIIDQATERSNDMDDLSNLSRA